MKNLKNKILESLKHNKPIEITLNDLLKSQEN